MSFKTHMNNIKEFFGTGEKTATKPLCRFCWRGNLGIDTMRAMNSCDSLNMTKKATNKESAQSSLRSMLKCTEGNYETNV